jgi:hypothetical protein
MSDKVPPRLEAYLNLFGYGPPCCKLTESGKHQRDCPRLAAADYNQLRNATEQAADKLLNADPRNREPEAVGRFLVAATKSVDAEGRLDVRDSIPLEGDECEEVPCFWPVKDPET